MFKVLKWYATQNINICRVVKSYHTFDSLTWGAGKGNCLDCSSLDNQIMITQKYVSSNSEIFFIILLISPWPSTKFNTPVLGCLYNPESHHKNGMVFQPICQAWVPSNLFHSFLSKYPKPRMKPPNHFVQDNWWHSSGSIQYSLLHSNPSSICYLFL